MKENISMREVARRIGVSHTALQKAQRSGRIAREADGTWNVDNVRQGMAMASVARLPVGRLRKSTTAPPWATLPQHRPSRWQRAEGAALSIHDNLELARSALQRAALQMAQLYPEILQIDRARDLAIAAQEAEKK